MPKFFISCPINFENICASEISLKWPLFLDTPIPKLLLIKGGIEIETDLNSGLSLNHLLKTPSKVLLRLKEQKCKDIPKLYNIIKKFNWKLYLKKHSANWNITTHQSRLINTKKIQKACEEGLNDYFNANSLSQKILDNIEYTDQNILLRIDNDQLTISLDTSGDLLHIRGDRAFRGHASIRENLASALLIKLLGTNNINKSLLDPMCGTATFLSEAKNFFSPTQRFYSYYNWHTKCDIKNIDNIWNLELFGRDIDQKILDKIKIQDAQLNCIDLFKDNDQLKITDFIILNPPYGKRVKISSNPKEYFEKLITVLTQKYESQKIGILIPETIKINRKKFNNHQIIERVPFNNNGIRINFFILEKQ